MKEFSQFTRGSGRSERRCLNFARRGEVSTLGWLLLPPTVSPFHRPLTLRIKHPSRRHRRPSVSPHKLYFLAPIRHRISVTSWKNMSTQPDCRRPLCNTQGPSGASLWTWQLQGTFQPWKVYLVISANVPKWNILLSKLSWYKPVVGRQ